MFRVSRWNLWSAEALDAAVAFELHGFADWIRRDYNAPIACVSSPGASVSTSSATLPLSTQTMCR